VKDMVNNINCIVVLLGILDPKDKLYKLCNFPKKDLGLIALIAKFDEQKQNWHEIHKHLNV